MPHPLDDFRRRHRQRFGFDLIIADARGRILRGEAPPTDCSCGGAGDRRRLQAAEQTRYWGETVINLCCDDGYGIWAIPVMNNNRMEAALVVQGVELEGRGHGFAKSVEEAAAGLLRMAVEANLVGEAALELARRRASEERERFVEIEARKHQEGVVSDDLREIYLLEEPDLLAAIKEGELGEARAILNRILTGIYGLAGDRIELLKSCVLELVVMMSRAAVEAGAEPAAVLGRNYRSLVELSDIDDEEDLSGWVRRMLETLIEGIRGNTAYPHSLLLLRAIQHMRRHLHEHLRRDDVARVAGVSPSHFSKLVTERMGRSFTQLLAQMRVNHARELLVKTDRSLTEIAVDCGFCDQSHFSKVFRSLTSCSPGEYRRRLVK